MIIPRLVKPNRHDLTAIFLRKPAIPIPTEAVLVLVSLDPYHLQPLVVRLWPPWQRPLVPNPLDSSPAKTGLPYQPTNRHLLQYRDSHMVPAAAALGFAATFSVGALAFLFLLGGLIAAGGAGLAASVMFTSGAGIAIRVVVGLALILLGLIQAEVLPHSFHAAERRPGRFPRPRPGSAATTLSWGWGCSGSPIWRLASAEPGPSWPVWLGRRSRWEEPPQPRRPSSSPPWPSWSWPSRRRSPWPWPRSAWRAACKRPDPP
jgi:hypothetical protein